MPVRLLAVLLLAVTVSVALAQSQPVRPRSTVPGAHHEPNPRARAEVDRARENLRTLEFDQALRSAEAAARYDSLSSEVHELLGACYLGAERPREAYSAYARAALLDPGSANAVNRAGQVLLQYLGRPAAAKAAFDQALAVNPKHAPTHYSLHYYHLLRGEFEPSLAALEAAHEQARTEEERLVYLGAQQVFFLYSGQYETAVGKLQSHNMQVSGDGRALQAQALAHRLVGWQAEAALDLRQLLAATRSPDPGLVVDLGLTLRATGERDSARAYFEQAQEIDGKRFEAHYNLVLESLAAGDTAAALAGLARARDAAPALYTVPLLAGELHVARGDLEAARRAFACAYRLAPVSRVAARAVAREPLFAADWETDTLFVAVEEAMRSGDAGIAAHKCLQAAAPEDSRRLGLVMAAVAKLMTPRTAGHRVAHLEAARERTDEKDALARAFLETQLAVAHAEIGNHGDAEKLFTAVLGRAGLPADDRAPAAAGYLRWALASGRAASVAADLAAFDAVDDPDLWRLRAELAAVRADTAEEKRCRERAQALAYLP